LLAGTSKRRSFELTEWSMVRTMANQLGSTFVFQKNVSAREISYDLCRFLKANPAAHDATGDDLMMVWMKGRYECNGR
jgi:hypothetical protein